jgi:hypothetical protein
MTQNATLHMAGVNQDASNNSVSRLEVVHFQAYQMVASCIQGISMPPSPKRHS